MKTIDIIDIKEITIEKLTESDLDEVVKIEKDTFAKPWSKTDFINELQFSFSRFYIVKYKNKIIGYGGYRVFEDTAEIVNIAISKDFRRKSIGKKLLEFLINEIKDEKIKKIYLEVKEDNIPAINLYTNFRFKIIYRRRNYYGNKDAFVMEKDL